MRRNSSQSKWKRNSRSGSYGIAAAFGIAFLLGFAAPAHAQFLLNAIFNGTAPAGTGWTPVANDGTNGAAIETTIKAAVQTYENAFTNPITVNIAYFEMTGGLGENEANIVQENYSSVYSALKTNANTVNANTAVANLPNQTNDPINVSGHSGDSVIWVTTANARALGFSTTGVTIDAWVAVNTSLTNDSSPYNQNSSHYSLLSTVEHETDEALGLGSGLNLIGDTGLGGSGAGGAYTSQDPIRMQDLFRFSAPNVRSYSTSASTSYFSINNGATSLVSFNQTGGGSDYGDWASESPAKVQDAFGTQGSTPSLTNDGGVELEALNVQGYTMASGAASGTPEPGSLALLGAGATLTGYGWLRRKRARKSVA